MSRTHDVVLEFEDGATTTIEVPEDVPVLEAALGQGVRLLHQCRSGSCGTCCARVVEGTTVMQGERAIGLLPSEVDAGYRLTCSTSVRSPAHLRLPYPSDAVFGPGPQRWSATVADVVRLSDTVSQLTLRLDGGRALAFAAGQYMRLEVPGTDEWRSYSMATTVTALPELSFLVKVLERGAMSGYLPGARPGQSIRLEGPYGAFRLRPYAGRHLMVAGGTGIAPILAMLDELRTAPGRTPPVTVCFACRSERNLFYVDELELRAMWMPTLELRIGVSRPLASSYRGRVGNPVDLIEDRDIVDGVVDAYLCGPAGMVDVARRRLVDAGVPGERIRAEQFVASPT